MKDITNQRFNHLIAIKFLKRNKRSQQIWLFRCDCGKEKEYPLCKILYNNPNKSCGCKLGSLTKFNSIKHGLSYTRIYNIYRQMKRRCYNSNHKGYKDYGGRGIKIDKIWLNSKTGFINFYNWAITNGYQNNLSIDRINVNGNYEPSNCRWATNKEQAENTTRTINLTFNNKTQSLKSWSKELNIPYSTLMYRYKQKFSINKILSRR